MQKPTSEQTPLLRPPITPTYVFNSATLRQRRNKIRNIQCCICTTLLFTFSLALIISISYNMEHPIDLKESGANNLSSISNDSLQTLLTLSWPRSDTTLVDWSNASVDKDLMEAVEAGSKALEYRDKYEESGNTLYPGSPAFRAQMALGATPPAMILARAGYAMDYATRNFLKNNSLNDTRNIGNGPAINASWILPACRINVNMSCPISKYRFINGSCNNKQHPSDWGVAFTPFRRVIPPAYADGVSSPRVAHDGLGLPSARQVSIQVHRPIYRADPDFTVVLAVWGQFLDHDITATAISKGANGSSISCCGPYTTPGRVAHPECFPVKLSKGDPNYDKYNVSCMEFVRSAPAPSCFLGPRNQLNQATAFIDGSTVYGPYEELAFSLRSFDQGQLKMMMTPDGRELLPASHDPNDGCNESKLNKQGKYCFISGDLRANENLHLTTMHLIWARQHNRLAKKLHRINPHWNDEQLYQESRRILSAQMQHITYAEFLPVLLRPQIMDKLELMPKSRGYYFGYNSTMEPNIANHFAASAFRFAHTLLPTLMKVIDSQSHSPEYVHLHKMLFNPYSLYAEGGLDRAMSGAMQTDMQKVDPFFTPELTSHLFERDEPAEPSIPGINPSSPCGLDLVSLNIQRGRDHGLPSYPAWREYCGFERPKSFADLKDVMDSDSLNRISTIYKTIEDVDLYTASLSEVPMKDSVLGATVTCLLLDQFVRLKRGDRFWYETHEKPQAFTERQLDEIRKTTLAGVVCRNGDSLKEAQKYVMRNVAPDNPLIDCKDHPEPDLKEWIEPPMDRVAVAPDLGSTIAIIKPNV